MKIVNKYPRFSRAIDLILHLSLHIYNITDKQYIMYFLVCSAGLSSKQPVKQFSNAGSKLLSIFFSQGFSKGLNLREYAFDNIQISADGIMSSDYVDEFDPSLTLNVNQTLRMHAGSRIEVGLKRKNKPEITDLCW